jgi:hypothetical protein
LSSAGLHGARTFQRQFIEVALEFALRNPSLAHQPPEVSVGADVVEAVIVHAHVREVMRHSVHGAFASESQELQVPECIELQQRRAIEKTLCPLGPAARRVFALHGIDGRGRALGVIAVDRPNLAGGDFPKTLDFRLEIRG